MDLETQGGDKLPIVEFELDEMCPNPSIIMIASRGSGKSWITRAILFKYTDIPVGLIISETEKDDPFFSHFFPDSYIYYKYDTKIIRKLILRQKMILKKKRDKYKEGKYIDPRAILIMDDCLADKGSWAKDPLVYDLLFNGRHRQITYILTMQYPLGITPNLRANFDYVFVLAEDIVSNMKRIYDHYAGMFPDFISFRQIFRQLTEDYGAMVIKNCGKKAGLLSKVAFYKAPNLDNKKAKFGCYQFRKYHKENYNEKWEEDGDKLDYEEYLLNKKKDKSLIDVKKLYKND